MHQMPSISSWHCIMLNQGRLTYKDWCFGTHANEQQLQLQQQQQWWYDYSSQFIHCTSNCTANTSKPTDWPTKVSFVWSNIHTLSCFHSWLPWWPWQCLITTASPAWPWTSAHTSSRRSSPFLLNESTCTPVTVMCLNGPVLICCSRLIRPIQET